ncbi:hypothetical protein NECAME_07827 [Necator americanus]|uniref:Uncharacterized protein n=1 Tax=Necator americanus TaxID=51031 RepID=W2TNL4_NECAM|nr:hypothetical protein NECAME_07827 [Necator americanus]ETN82716.1 hypothetical protein NECAME_07827 [Necator americanus]
MSRSEQFAGSFPEEHMHEHLITRKIGTEIEIELKNLKCGCPRSKSPSVEETEEVQAVKPERNRPHGPKLKTKCKY